MYKVLQALKQAGKVSVSLIIWLARQMEGGRR